MPLHQFASQVGFMRPGHCTIQRTPQENNQKSREVCTQIGMTERLQFDFQVVINFNVCFL